MGIDYYGVLEINRSATLDDIQRAYRKLSLKYHPSRYEDCRQRGIFHDLAEAYDVLNNPKTKSLYDQFGEEGIKKGVPQPPAPDETVGPTETYVFHGDPYKVFRDFFGVDNPFAEVKLPNIDPEYKYCPIPEKEKIQGENMTIYFDLPLEEAFRGCWKKMTIKQRLYDNVEKKTVDVDKTYRFQVPAGCTDKRRFVYQGAANQGYKLIPGNVVFVANLLPHEVFALEGKNFVIRKTLQLAHALCGCVVDVTTMQGKVAHLSLSGVTKPGQRITLPGDGMTIENSTDRGDLFVEFDIEFPDRLNHLQKELIKSAFLKPLSNKEK